MKKHFKKTLAILLVATSFTFLYTTLGTSNVLTYADVNTALTAIPNPMEFSYETNELFAYNPDSCRKYGLDHCISYNYCYEVKNILGENTLLDARYWDHNHFKEYVIFDDSPVSIKKHICDEDPKFCDPGLQKQLFQKAKDEIHETLGLNYTNEIETPINVIKDFLGWDLYGCYHPKLDIIYITKKSLFDDGVLSHEMTHALIRNILGEEREENFNLGINEGLATQNNGFGSYGSPFSLDLENLDLESLDSKYHHSFWYFDKGPSYARFQYLINNWIKAEGKDIVKKYLGDVKNGKDSVQAFLDLGGDKVVEKFIEDSKAVKAFLDHGGDKLVNLIKTDKLKALFIDFIGKPIGKLLTYFGN